MDDLVKSLNRIENYTAKYIFNKYICNATDENNKDESISYKEFTDTIFGLERKAIITQEEVLNEDPFKQMNLADFEVIEFTPNTTSKQLNFLMEEFE